MTYFSTFTQNFYIIPYTLSLGILMNGTIMVTYRILCKSDFNKEVTLKKLFENEKVAKIIKSEFAKGFRNLDLIELKEGASLKIETAKELHTFEIQKDDFADIMDLAEEDAQNKKLIKKECERIELVDIVTSNAKKPL